MVFFTCNHCPYVLGSDEITRKTAEKFIDKDVRFLAINSNSKNTYEEDSFENMVKRMENEKFPMAVPSRCITGDSLGIRGTAAHRISLSLTKNRKLVYTGRGVDNPKDASRVTVNDLERTWKLTSGKKSLSKRPIP